MMLDFLHGAMQVLSQVGQAAADGPAAVVSAAGTLQTVADTTAQASGILHFISRSDVVGKSLFGILLAMSLISWYLIFVKIFMRSEEHTSELQSLMRISYAVFCLKKKKKISKPNNIKINTSNTKETPTNKK